MDTSMEEQKYIFTFGVGQEHAQHYVELHGTCDETRNEMFRMFGPRWSMQYEYEKGRAIIDVWHYKRLEVDSVLACRTVEKKKIVSLVVGEQIGEVCNRNGCKGVLEDSGAMDDVSCCCHLGNPPCSKCVYDPTYCPECEWEPEQA